MAAFLKLKPSFPKLRPLIFHQRFCHTTVFEGGTEADFLDELGPILMAASDDADTPKWKKLDARSLGLRLSMIPSASRTVIKVLQSEGHDAFLVGGCVRDLLLNRIPKDFDVITTADLKKIKKKFCHAYIIGRRSPICKVHLKGSAIEVSSFGTVASGKEKEVNLPEIPKGFDEKDLIRWRNSMCRDFTVNSLFYDPFAHKIYDYSGAMTDIKAMKIRTLVPAHSSFQVDCARILRGLRIAARLGFSFTEETEKAIQNLYPSVKTLDKTRLMMEMNYMLSYGAAQSSLLLLKRFRLLEILLPFHAAYLADNSGQQSPPMLLELFSKLDGVVSCDQPCDSSMWLSLLVFHLALVNNPQDALVVWTISSLLYHGTWEEGIKAARELSKQLVKFSPEICNTCDDVADDELAQRISNFGSIILESIGTLTGSKSLRKIMHRYPSSPCSNVVFVSKNAGRAVADIFNVLVGDIKALNKSRNNYAIDYELLRMGDKLETRYVLGKVIMNTMRGFVSQNCPKLLSEKKDNFHASNRRVEQPRMSKKPYGSKGAEKNRLGGLDDQLDRQTIKKQKLVNEKAFELLSRQMLKKGAEKDVKELFSLTAHQDGKSQIWQDLVHYSNDISTVLENKMGKMHDDQPYGKTLITPEVLKSHRTQASTEIWKVLKDSKYYSKQGRQTTMEAEDRDESKTRKNPNLSSIFR